MRFDVKDHIQVKIPQQQDDTPQRIRAAVDECSLVREIFIMEKAEFGDDKNLLALLSNVDFFAKFHVLVEINWFRNREEERGKFGLQIISLKKYQQKVHDAKKYISDFYKN